MSASVRNLLRMPLRAAETLWQGFVNMSSDSRTPRLLKRIGTHNGVFHCDEAFACFMLKQLPEYLDAEIVLDTCDVVIDVGGVYNPETNRYDHHQRDFDHTLSTILPDLADSKHIKLSSAGLVYAHYGFKVVSEVLKRIDFVPSTECLRVIFLAVYEGFVEELDAIDNGVPMYTEGTPRYRINTHLSARVHRLNPEWNSPDTDSSDALFTKAMKLVGTEFTDKVVETATIWWPAREIVRSSILSRKHYFDTGEIVKLKESCPWKDHLLSLEKEMGIEGEIKFVIFHDLYGSWRVQGVPLQPDSFICRIFLHKDWWGVRDEKLSNVAGIDGCIFCHPTGFIAGNRTEKGALQMAIRSLDLAGINKD